MLLSSEVKACTDVITKYRKGVDCISAQNSNYKPEPPYQKFTAKIEQLPQSFIGKLLDAANSRRSAGDKASKLSCIPERSFDDSSADVQAYHSSHNSSAQREGISLRQPQAS